MTSVLSVLKQARQSFVQPSFSKTHPLHERLLSSSIWRVRPLYMTYSPTITFDKFIVFLLDHLYIEGIFQLIYVWYLLELVEIYHLCLQDTILDLFHPKLVFHYKKLIAIFFNSSPTFYFAHILLLKVQIFLPLIHITFHF